MKKASFLFLFALFFLCSFAQVMPNANKIRWNQAGYQGNIPDYTTLIDISLYGAVGNGVTPNDAAYSAALAALGSASGVIYFPAGSYVFNSPIVMRDSLILRGAGVTSRILITHGGANTDGIVATGSVQVADTTWFTAPTAIGDSAIYVNDVSFLSVGDYVRIIQNDSSLVTSTWAYKTVSQINKILAINGNEVLLQTNLHKSYTLAENPRLLKVNPVREIGIECLYIDRTDATVGQTSNINLNYAVQSWVIGVESNRTNFAHIALNNCAYMDVYGSYFHHAHAYGGGGQGYGLAIQMGSSSNRVQNNIFRNLRHSMLLQAGANGNVFGYNYSRDAFWNEGAFPTDAAGDIVLHGNWVYGNLFEGNVVQNIVVDNSHGPNGHYNALFRNRSQNYGIVFDGSTNNQGIIGNECTNTGFFKGQYSITGTGHTQAANNVRGTITPAGTVPLNDTSYYYSNGRPTFLVGQTFRIGPPSTLNQYTIPAFTRYQAGTNFTLCDRNRGIIPFPVNLLSFSGKNEGESNVLTWKVSEEREMQAYQLYWQNEGKIWGLVGQVPAKGDDFYQFKHDFPQKGENIYRLFELTSDGLQVQLATTFVYADAVKAFRIYPNPARDFIQIHSNSSLEICLFTLEGKQIQSVSPQKISENEYQIPVQFLAKGLYWMELLQEGSVFREKVIVE